MKLKSLDTMFVVLIEQCTTYPFNTQTNKKRNCSKKRYRFQKLTEFKFQYLISKSTYVLYVILELRKKINSKTTTTNHIDLHHQRTINQKNKLKIKNTNKSQNLNNIDIVTRQNAAISHRASIERFATISLDHYNNNV